MKTSGICFFLLCPMRGAASQRDEARGPRVAAATERATARTTFSTQKPSLAEEQANASKLFQAFVELLDRVPAWSARLEAEVEGETESEVEASADPASSGASPSTEDQGRRLPSPSLARKRRSPHSTVPVPVPTKERRPHDPRATVHDRQPPPKQPAALLQPHEPPHASVHRLPPHVPPPDGRSESLPVATSSTGFVPLPSTQERGAQDNDDGAGDDDDDDDGEGDDNGDGDGMRAISPQPATTSSLTRVVPTNTNSNIKDDGDANRSVRYVKGVSSAHGGVVDTRRAVTPPWLSMEVRAFFERTLADAIQERESRLVNLLHDCFRQELQGQEASLRASRISEWEKDTAHLHSKLDRRVAENNALRKEFYKQLLMLRELVSKHKSDPRTLKALDEVITSMALGTENASAFAVAVGKTAWADDKQQDSRRGGNDGNAGTMGATAAASGTRREKEKWEQRAREAMAECHQLREQVAQLKQQVGDYGGCLHTDPWFASLSHALQERQRVLDCVHKGKCSWDDVGDAVVELLNNDLIWEAVEDSAYREKARVSRGLEAVLLRMESFEGMREDGDNTLPPSNADGIAGERIGSHGNALKRGFSRRQSSMSDGTRLVPCHACKGCGFLNSNSAVREDDDHENESYLRKTLAQVLQLKTSLEEMTKRADRAEQDVQRTTVELATVREKLEQIEYTRSHGVDCGLQTDLDDEEEIDVDEIMNAYYNDSDGCGSVSRRRAGRSKQYENLIVELKNSIAERDTGLSELRTTISDTQARLVAVQKASCQDQEKYQLEISSLKESLAFAISNRNDEIEAKQAAVQLILKNIPGNTQGAAPQELYSDEGSDDDSSSDDSNNDRDTASYIADIAAIAEKDEVKRSEKVARKYSDAIARVQQEYDEQQVLLIRADEELGQETEKRKRTNSVMLGNIAVTMTSHPRDLFKAASTAHSELLALRRSSQRSATLQTDRLLTLTTHLAHISEELCMVRKRTSTEIDYWKLECEKLHNTNKMTATDLKRTKQQFLATEASRASFDATNSSKVCIVCEKHEARLMALSNEMLSSSDATTSRANYGENRGSISGLAEFEHKSLCTVLLDLESLYSTLSSSKQQLARAFIAHALTGTDGNITKTVSSSRRQSAAYQTGTGVLKTTDVRDPNEHLDKSGGTGGGNATRQIWPAERRRVSTRSASQLSLGVITEHHDSEDGLKSESTLEENGIISSSVRNRLFQHSLLDPSAPVANTSMPVEPIALRGTSIYDAAIHHEAELIRDSSPSHRRKTVVREVLSEEEVRKRRRAGVGATSLNRLPTSEETGEENRDVSSCAVVVSSQDTRFRAPIDDGIPDLSYSTHIDAEGREIDYINVEDDERAGLEDTLTGTEFQGDESSFNIGLGMNKEDTLRRQSLANSEQYTTALQESPVNFPLAREVGNQQVASMVPTVPMHFAMLGEASRLDKDPEVLAQLRDIVNCTLATQQSLAFTNWSILICHIRAVRDQQRLGYINDEFKRVVAKHKLNATQTSKTFPEQLVLLRSTMQKLVQYREMCLDTAIRSRDEIRKETRRSQAHLIHSISTILTNIGRKNNEDVQNSGAYQLTSSNQERASPRRYNNPTYHGRSLYPSTFVNLSDIPPTQKVPTPHFQISTAKDVSRNGPCGGEFIPFSTPTHNVATIPMSASSSTDALSSVFENDNRFPQRVVTFLPSGDSDELSLTHSTSRIHLLSPKRSPARESFTLDFRRQSRPTQSAGTTRLRSPHVPDDKEMNHSDSRVDVLPVRPTSASECRRPVRPQSSPAGTHTRPIGQQSRDNELCKAMDVRPPENTASG